MRFIGIMIKLTCHSDPPPVDPPRHYQNGLHVPQQTNTGSCGSYSSGPQVLPVAHWNHSALQQQAYKWWNCDLSNSGSYLQALCTACAYFAHRSLQFRSLFNSRNLTQTLFSEWSIRRLQLPSELDIGTGSGLRLRLLIP